MPPVCPSPRPESCGTATPNEATSGASGSVILSPTPPVECLSTVRLPSPANDMRSPESIIASVRSRISRRSIPFSSTAIAQADICSSATTPRVNASISQRMRRGVERVTVALGGDHLDGVERFGHRTTLEARDQPAPTGPTVMNTGPCTQATAFGSGTKNARVECGGYTRYPSPFCTVQPGSGPPSVPMFVIRSCAATESPTCSVTVFTPVWIPVAGLPELRAVPVADDRDARRAAQHARRSLPCS